MRSGLRRQLERLRTTIEHDQGEGDQTRRFHRKANARDWYECLTLATEHPDQLAQLKLDPALLPMLQDAVAQLREYLAAGPPGVYLEYYCDGRLDALAGWLHAKPGDPSFGGPIPFGSGEAAHIRECIQIDRWEESLRVGLAMQ